MKKIALIMDGWKRFFTCMACGDPSENQGNRRRRKNLYIFNSSGDWSLDDDYNIGEYNIYSLPNLSDFDGIILDTNNIRYPDVSKRGSKEDREACYFHCQGNRRFLLCWY